MDKRQRAVEKMERFMIGINMSKMDGVCQSQSGVCND